MSLLGWEKLLTAGNIAFIAHGFVVTIELVLLASAISFVLAPLIAVGRLSLPRFAQWPLVLYVDIVRNIPLLLLIFFMRYGPSTFGIKLDSFGAAVMALTAFNAAYLAEIIRGGILSVPRGQSDAALVTGLSRWQLYREIILPQALRNMLPALVQQFIILVVGTPLVSIIDVVEATASGQVISAKYANPMEVLSLLAVCYFVINFSLSSVGRRLEKYISGGGVAEQA